MFKKCGKIMEKHVGQSSALQEIDRWSSCKFSTAGKHSVSDTTWVKIISTAANLSSYNLRKDDDTSSMRHIGVWITR